MSASPWRSWYGGKRWRIMRARQLREHPLCQCPFCQEGAKAVTPAEVVDHIRPHRGDPVLFYDPANLQSMGQPCHDRFKQSEERGGLGFNRGAEDDGTPRDPQHHWNQGSKANGTDG